MVYGEPTREGATPGRGLGRTSTLSYSYALRLCGTLGNSARSPGGSWHQRGDPRGICFAIIFDAERADIEGPADFFLVFSEAGEPDLTQGAHDGAESSVCDFHSRQRI